MLHQSAPPTALSVGVALLVAGTAAPAAGQQQIPPKPTAPPPAAVPGAPSSTPPPSVSPDVPSAATPQEAPPAPRVAPQQSYLGVILEDVTAEDVERLGLPEESGALVREIVDGSPADSAGFRPGDVVVRWHGEPVFSAAELGRLVRETPAGRRVRVELYREGERITLSVSPGEGWRDDGFHGRSAPFFRRELPPETRARVRERLEHAREKWKDARGRMEGLDERLEGLDERMEWARDVVDDSLGVHGFRFAPALGSHRARLGVRLQGLTPQLAEYFGLGDRSGVLVASVRDGSAADSAGLQAGDVLLTVAREEVADVGDAARAIRDASGEVELRVLRRGEERTLVARLPDPGEEDDSGDR